ncbi:MAG: RNA polymerase sporulation sigma factor SigK [Oscillospiraceae bacterium]|nr:RNA polymerase sporulation sigma factor SigK [Oscillospiraceae bacterium]
MFSQLLALLSDFSLFFALYFSSGTFPRPLSPGEEADCFRRMRAGDPAARDELIRRNMRLVVHIVKKYYAGPGEQDDLVSVGTIGLIKAVGTYRDGRGTRFSTYASRCIENEILMQFRQSKKAQNTVSISDPLDTDADGNTLSILDVVAAEGEIGDALEHSCDAARAVGLVQRVLTPRERRITELRYGLSGQPPLTQQAVAKRLGISRSYVSRLESKALAKLRAAFDDPSRQT